MFWDFAQHRPVGVADFRRIGFERCSLLRRDLRRGKARLHVPGNVGLFELGARLVEQRQELGAGAGRLEVLAGNFQRRKLVGDVAVELLQRRQHIILGRPGPAATLADQLLKRGELVEQRFERRFPRHVREFVVIVSDPRQSFDIGGLSLPDGPMAEVALVCAMGDGHADLFGRIGELRRFGGRGDLFTVARAADLLHHLGADRRDDVEGGDRLARGLDVRHVGVSAATVRRILRDARELSYAERDSDADFAAEITERDTHVISPRRAGGRAMHNTTES